MSDFIQFFDNPLEHDVEMFGNSSFDVVMNGYGDLYASMVPVTHDYHWTYEPTPALFGTSYASENACINPTLLYSEPQPAGYQTGFVPEASPFSLRVDFSYKVEPSDVGLHSGTSAISSSSSSTPSSSSSPTPPSHPPRVPKKSNHSRTKRVTLLPRYEYLLQHGTPRMHGNAVWIACNAPSCPFFGRPADMVRHLTTHNPELRPRCGGCPAVLARGDALKRHLAARPKCKYPDEERLQAREVYMKSPRGMEKMRRCEGEESAKVRMGLTHELIADFDEFVGETRMTRGNKPKAA